MSVSLQSAMPSPSRSPGSTVLSSGSVLHSNSSKSLNPSPSSSVSALFPIPSASVSVHSAGSRGKASEVSTTPSLSSSVSTQSGIVSPSVSKETLKMLIKDQSHRLSRLCLIDHPRRHPYLHCFQCRLRLCLTIL